MRRVIILEKSRTERTAFRYAMWAAVPPERQAMYANASATSAFKSASAQELQDIRDGKVVELVDTLSVEDGNATLAQIKAFLQSAWQNFQNNVTSEAAFSRYGTSWDGTTWTAAGF
jgi:hypothetical protein